MIESGAMVYFQCPKNSWVLGTCETWDGSTGICRPKDSIDGRDPVANLKDHQIFVARDDVITEDVSDLLNLTVLHDATLLNTLKRRYLRDVIYTNIGAIVVALNPFNFKIPWYQDDKMPDYLAEGDTIEKNLPHSWAVAHNTYFEMRNDKQNQCVLVSGESGAGKTEASKIVMKYLAAISCKTGTDQQKERGKAVGVKINLTSPPLEAFGNAKTVRNDNSSRFGKFMQVKFDDAGFLIGAFITKYLLEKSRIVTSAENERVYHALYLVVRGGDQKLQVAKDSEFKILNQGKCVNNKEFDTKDEFHEVTEAMKAIGIDSNQVNSMWSVVAAILHMGNIAFQPDDEGSIVNASTSQYVGSSCALLKIDPAVLEKELLTTTLSVAGQLITKVLNPTAALDVKESLMKSLYDFEFQWLVDKCNEMLDVQSSSNWIGLLDIFGFEDFKINSFEQLCINLTNETLQGHYNEYIFQRDLDECRAEGVDMSQVEFPDNGPCIQMITGKTGIMALLDEECQLGKATDMSFLAKVTTACNGNQFFVRKLLQKSSFTVRHYAGDVAYEVEGFLDKNRDTLKDAFKLLVRSSTDDFIAQLLPEPVEAKKITVGGFFKKQLEELMAVLNSTNPHWIRCIKPHPAKKPLMWHGINVMNQLSSSGVLGTVKIRKAGYPVRIKHADFIGRYNILGKSNDEILKSAGIKGIMAQIGKIRVFLKSEAYIQLEHAKKEALQSHAKTIQGFFLAGQEAFVVKQRQRENNKGFIEVLRKQCVKIIEFLQYERREREALQAKFIKTKEDLKTRHEENIKDMMKEWRRIQVERLREQYERKQREEAALAEKQRLERLKEEARRKKAEEKARQEQELRDLEAAAIHARIQRQERELNDAIAAREGLHNHLKGKADEVFYQRLVKREEDRKKAEAAKQRRTQLEQMTIDKLRQVQFETERQQSKGEIIKSKSQFEALQKREEEKIKLDGRRREVSNKLQEEAERKQRFMLMNVAMADAKFTFQQEQRRQVARDNNIRHHVQHIEAKEHQKEVEVIREIAVRKEHKEAKQSRDALKNMQSTIKTFQHKSDQARQQMDRMLRPFFESAGGVKQSRDQRAHHLELTNVRKQISHVGEDVYKTRSGQQEKTTTRAFKKTIQKPKPEHIDPHFYQNLQCEKQAIVEKFSTAALANQPMQTLPWRR